MSMAHRLFTLWHRQQIYHTAQSWQKYIHTSCEQCITRTNNLSLSYLKPLDHHVPMMSQSTYLQHPHYLLCVKRRCSNYKRKDSMSKRLPLDHPTVLQKLASLEDSLRYHGYSTLRIGLAIVIVTDSSILDCDFVPEIQNAADPCDLLKKKEQGRNVLSLLPSSLFFVNFLNGFGIYIFRGHIRANVAEEVSTVATMSLGDKSVKIKMQELSVALLQTLLNNEDLQNQAVEFLKKVFDKPATKEALASLLLGVLNDPEAKTKLAVTLKQILQAALSDEAFRKQLSSNLRILLMDEDTKQALIELMVVLNDGRMQTESRKFLSDVIASKQVREESATLGKHVIHDIVSDPTIQKKAGDAMWAAFTYSLTPRVFGGGHSPTDSSKTIPNGSSDPKQEKTS